MKHLSEEQIVLHYYGDAENEREIAQHLGDCPACRGEFERVERLLREIEPAEVPEPPAVFEEKIWLKLRDRLPARRAGPWQWLGLPLHWAGAPGITGL